MGSRCLLSSFNPTLVRLRHSWDSPNVPDINCFNPTLVRLRRRSWFSDEYYDLTFQSHAGSIEATSMGLLSEIKTYSFNPTLVRLRLGAPAVARTTTSAVSIPRWFD
mgnify:CR=1 FL=1